MKNPILSVPVQLMQYAFAHDLRKPFGLFLYMKSHSSGLMHAGSQEFIQAKENLGIKDQRTFDKYINILLSENWIGFDPISGNYFIRGFMELRKRYSLLKRQSVRFHYCKHIENLDVFMWAAITAATVKSYEYWKRRKKWTRSATKQRGVAEQDLLNFPDLNGYSGVSVRKMAEMLNLSSTRTCGLKKKAISLGYIVANKQFREFTTLTTWGENFKRNIEKSNPEIVHKLKSYKVVENGKEVVKIMEQLHDEIITTLDFTSIRIRPKREKYLCAANRGNSSKNILALADTKEVYTENILNPDDLFTEVNQFDEEVRLAVC
jgi:hypothetical protein